MGNSVITGMRPNKEFVICFEVISDVLYVSGRTLYRGDMIRFDELGDLAYKLASIGMLRVVNQIQQAA